MTLIVNYCRTNKSQNSLPIAFAFPAREHTYLVSIKISALMHFHICERENSVFINERVTLIIQPYTYIFSILPQLFSFKLDFTLQKQTSKLSIK